MVFILLFSVFASTERKQMPCQTNKPLIYKPITKQKIRYSVKKLDTGCIIFRQTSSFSSFNQHFFSVCQRGSKEIQFSSFFQLQLFPKLSYRSREITHRKIRFLNSLQEIPDFLLPETGNTLYPEPPSRKVNRLR